MIEPSVKVNVDIDATAIEPLCNSADKVAGTILGGIGALFSPGISLFKAWADQKAALIRDDLQTSLAERALDRELHISIRRQRNLDSIADQSIRQLPPSVTTHPVNQDWAARFVADAQDISEPDLQTLWARVLAKEVQQPEAISRRTLTILRDISTEEARIFATTARICWRFTSMREACIVTPWNPFSKIRGGNVELSSFGVEFWHLEQMRDIGLLNTTQNTLFMLSEPIELVCGAIRINMHRSTTAGDSVEIPAMFLTRSGADLLAVCDVDANTAFLDHAQKFLSVRGAIIEYGGMQ